MKFEISRNKYAFLDGAIGTTLQKAGAPCGRPEILCLTNSDVVRDIHRAYIDAGADVVFTNTFGANELKLSGTGYSPEEIISAAVRLAKEAAAGTKTAVALSVGPLGEMTEPNGVLTFEKAYECFARMVKVGAESGADLVVLETMSDLCEVKAGILAVKENASLPVFASMTFDGSGRTFSGCAVEAFAVLAESLGASAAGINCGLGPDKIYPLAKRLCGFTSLPVFVKPNAGLPDPSTGKYGISASEFAESLSKFADVGVSAVGGCCGTAPEYIRALRKAFEGKTPAARTFSPRSVVSSATRVVEIGEGTVVGEKINPTGKKRLAEALSDGDTGYVLKLAVEQAEDGAEILDVNVGAPGIDEKIVLPRVVKRIQSVVDLPLQLDSSDAEALERAARVYIGKPIINSVDGDEKVLKKILPAVKKYGTAVIGLTLDGKGIPEDAEGRVAVAKRISEKAKSFGIKKEDLFIDCLTLPVSAGNSAFTTLDALERIRRETGLKTALGVSNIGFGLPERGLLNRTFLTAALRSGLDLAIADPGDSGVKDAVGAFRALSGRDKDVEEYIEVHGTSARTPSDVRKNDGEKDDDRALSYAVANGLAEAAAEAAKRLLSFRAPLDIVNGILIPALDEAGKLFGEGKLFLPNLLRSARAAEKVFDEIRKALPDESEPKKGPVVLATVKGDIHDIGKNIVGTLLKNYGFRVIDLGKDVSPETVVETAEKTGARLIGLSALMTTTLNSMEDTVRALRDSGLSCKIMVGGAVLTPEYAEKIGADFYAEDARKSVDIAREVFGDLPPARIPTSLQNRI